MILPGHSMYAISAYLGVVWGAPGVNGAAYMAVPCVMSGLYNVYQCVYHAILTWTFPRKPPQKHPNPPLSRQGSSKQFSSYSESIDSSCCGLGGLSGPSDALPIVQGRNSMAGRAANLADCCRQQSRTFNVLGSCVARLGGLFFEKN